MWLIKEWLNLESSERSQYLRALAFDTGRSPFALEKDIWVVDVLRCLFESEFKDHIQFKGGTSLSKGFEKKIISIDYPFYAEGVTKESARIKIEFETRSSTAPSIQVPIAPYATAMPGFILWDDFSVPCMPPEITFWEKITAIYRLTNMQNLEWQLGRHWFDVVQIWEKVGHEKILNKSVVETVVRQTHARGKDNLDYLALLEGNLVLTYDPSAHSKALIVAIEETIARGYFQNVPDIPELINSLGKLEISLNNFLRSIDF